MQQCGGVKFGARDLRRTIRRTVEDPMAEKLVEGTLGVQVHLDAQNGKMLLNGQEQ
ncbi:protein containing Clp ATPase [gut metagenome]|uniref:Protein containing Clp ATPase n=1 Tax=gut metagenome TaxID=749906 RepID=J9GSE4_9ZZZZ